MVAIFLAPIYILVNIYVLLRSMKWLEICHGFFHNKWFRRIFCAVYIVLSTSILTAFFLPMGMFQRVMKLISNYWLGTFLYIVLFIGIADLLLLLLKQVRKHNKHIFERRKILAFVGGVVFFGVCGMSGYGIYHANQIQIKKYDITVETKEMSKDKLKIVLVADLHLGYNVGKRLVGQMVEKINSQNPDIVCFAGDMFDNEYHALGDPEGVIELLKGIKSTYGSFGCFGNHDIEEPILAGFTFGSKETKVNGEKMIAFMEKANITLLRDEAISINDEFYLIGRRDEERPGHGKSERKTISELTRGLDTTKPIVVMDHQPRELKELAYAGVDLDLSGHTHGGQMFPANLLMGFIWENPWGYLQVDTMHSFVTSGIGVFGPNMRTFTDSEIMSIEVTFT